jgi:hypothetical protein
MHLRTYPTQTFTDVKCAFYCVLAASGAFMPYIENLPLYMLICLLPHPLQTEARRLSALLSRQAT